MALSGVLVYERIAQACGDPRDGEGVPIRGVASHTRETGDQIVTPGRVADVWGV